MKNKKVIIGVIIAILLIILALVFLLPKKEEEKKTEEKVKEYTVTFKDKAGNEDVKVKEGNLVAKKEINDESFAGWYEEGKEEKFDFNTEINKDYVLESRYKEKYTISYKTAGGSEIASIEIYEGDTIKEPEIPTKEGYKFVEWQVNGEKFDFSKGVEGNIELEAVWAESDEKVEVKFDTAGGSTINPVKVKINTAVSKPKNPTKSGYDFVRWTKDGKEYNFSEKVTTNITLKAEWKAVERYTVTFVADGKTVSTKKVYRGNKVGTLPTAPAKSGYVFTGWYSGDKTYTADNRVYSNIKITAKYITTNKDKLNKTVNTIKNINIKMEKGGENLVPKISNKENCTITALNTPSSITRETSDKVISVNFKVVCGTESATVAGKVTIVKSPYTYTKVANSNMINYDVTVQGGSWPSDARLYIGSGGSFRVTSRKAIVENGKIESNPVFQMKFDNDSTTIYKVKIK